MEGCNWKVVLIMGVSGSGKSTLMTAFERLNFRCVEGDDLHPQANVDKMHRGEPLTDVDRLPWLSTIAEQLKSAVAAGSSLVLTCSALKRSYRALLAPYVSLFVFLKGSQQFIASRLNARTNHFFNSALLPSQFADLEEPTPAELGANNLCVIDIEKRTSIESQILCVKGKLQLHTQQSGTTCRLLAASPDTVALIATYYFACSGKKALSSLFNMAAVCKTWRQILYESDACQLLYKGLCFLIFESISTIDTSIGWRDTFFSMFCVGSGPSDPSMSWRLLELLHSMELTEAEHFALTSVIMRTSIFTNLDQKSSSISFSFPDDVGSIMVSPGNAVADIQVRWKNVVLFSEHVGNVKGNRQRHQKYGDFYYHINVAPGAVSMRSMAIDSTNMMLLMMEKLGIKAVQSPTAAAEGRVRSSAFFVVFMALILESTRLLSGQVGNQRIRGPYLWEAFLVPFLANAQIDADTGRSFFYR